MIVKCEQCKQFFDDQFRSTTCPHNTFLANNGRNWFSHYPQAWLAGYEPRITIPILDKSNNVGRVISEYDAYQEWLNKNRVVI